MTLYTNINGRRPFKKQKGIAMVEFAVGVIILLLLMLVVAEAGRAFFSYNTLTKAVRGGVRYIAANALKEDDSQVVSLTNQKITETRNMVIYGDLGGGTPVLPSVNAHVLEDTYVHHHSSSA